jgi:ubiquinone/menaquinone biosynthesis C-methylase UbiE
LWINEGDFMTVGTPESYPLGRSQDEARRLMLQHQIYGPASRRLLAGAGITAGMRVLDLGSGAGDMALLVADLVGPQGQVVGVDINPAILAIARARAEAAGWSNVDFREGDIHAFAADETFDAVVGRYVLMYVPDPVAVVRQCLSLLRPGGTVAFLEGDLATPVRAFPPGPLHERVTGWLTQLPRMVELQMGPKLFQVLRQAGIPNPHLRAESPIGGGATWPGFRYVAESTRSLLPVYAQYGVVDPADVDIDSLADRLRDEVVEQGGVQILSPLIGAFGRSR